MRRTELGPSIVPCVCNRASEEACRKSIPRRHSAPPAPLKASQLPMIRLAASLRYSRSDNGSPSIASCFVDLLD
jgi:hypothetical protein